MYDLLNLMGIISRARVAARWVRRLLCTGITSAGISCGYGVYWIYCPGSASATSLGLALELVLSSIQAHAASHSPAKYQTAGPEKALPFWAVMLYPAPWYPAIKLRSDEVRGVSAEAVP